MHQDKYWASKVPLPLALLFLINVILVIGCELLFFYKYPAVVDDAALVKYDSSLIGSTIVNRDESNTLHAYLVETAQGDHRLLVVKKHSIFFGKGKPICNERVEMPDSGELTVYVKNGIHTSEIFLQDIPSGIWAITVQYGYSGTVKESTAFYMVLAAALEALELLIIHFIKKNLQ